MSSRLATGAFTARVVKETSMSASPVADYGVVRNELTLFGTEGGQRFCVEWTSSDDESIYAEIGIICAKDTKTIVDYDGVFCLPREVAAFLRAQGFDTKEVEA